MQGKGTLLLEHAIAGVVHHTSASDLAELRDGDTLALVREPDNRYDRSAVRIDTLGGVKLGYVPRTYSGMVAALIDSGKLVLRAEVGDWIEPKKAICYFRLYLT